MAKSARKKAKGAISAKKTRKATKGRTNAIEHVDYLLALHKLQGVLLARLRKEIQ